MILAGGEGARLRALTTLIAGDERPKQFCKILGGQTLLDQTRRRAALLIDPRQTLLVLTRAHEQYYRPLLADVPPRCVVVQPAGRGTAPAIVYGLLRISEGAPTATVAILPSDHYISDDTAFMAHVAAAADAVSDRPDLIVLLGVAPESAEAEYGWIEPGDELPLGDLRRVRRFWEKPTPAVAEGLVRRGCLWNSFVMVARVPALLALIRRASPELWKAFQGACPQFGTAAEARAVERLYARLASTDFSGTVLSASPANLAVLAVKGTVWSDWGKPRRVLGTLAALGVRPEWAQSA